MADDPLRDRVLHELAERGIVLFDDVDPDDDQLALAVADWLGSTDIGIDEELSGPKVMHLRYDPMKAVKSARPAYFTADAFSLHTDMSYVDHPPKFLLTHCVYPDESGGGITLFSDCRAAFLQMPETERSILSQPIFRFAYPPGCPLGESNSLPIHDPGASMWRFRLDGMIIPDDAGDVVMEFSRRLNQLTQKIALKRGDLVIMDNHRIAHGRTQFDAAKSRRHLRRIYARRKQE